MAKQLWQAFDGKTFETEEEANEHEQKWRGGFFGKLESVKWLDFMVFLTTEQLDTVHFAFYEAARDSEHAQKHWPDWDIGVHEFIEKED